MKNVFILPLESLPSIKDKPIHIVSFGGLQVMVNGVCIDIQTCGPRIYQLMQHMVALGGKNISASSICDAIWPDVEGDKAMQNFEFTLRGLRKFLKKGLADNQIKEPIILLQHNKVSFNVHYCQLDTWQWYAITQYAGQSRSRGDIAQARALEAQASELIQGGFLLGDHDSMLHYQATWQTRICQWVTQILTHWQSDQAIAPHQITQLFDIAFTISPCSEKLCLLRMQFLIEEGYMVDAMRIYQDWLSYIQKTLGMQPSPKIQSVYASIIQA